MNNKEHLSVIEFAEKIGKHPNTIRNAIKNGVIKAFRLGRTRRGTFRIPANEIDRLMEFGIIDVIESKTQQPEGE